MGQTGGQAEHYDLKCAPHLSPPEADRFCRNELLLNYFTKC
jgi:hypothetical protein